MTSFNSSFIPKDRQIEFTLNEGENGKFYAAHRRRPFASVEKALQHYEYHLGKYDSVLISCDDRTQIAHRDMEGEIHRFTDLASFRKYLSRCNQGLWRESLNGSVSYFHEKGYLFSKIEKVEKEEAVALLNSSSRAAQLAISLLQLSSAAFQAAAPLVAGSLFVQGVSSGAVGPSFRINNDLTGDQSQSDVAALVDGYITTWLTNQRVRTQYLSANGTKLGGENSILNFNVTSPKVAGWSSGISALIYQAEGAELSQARTFRPDRTEIIQFDLGGGNPDFTELPNDKIAFVIDSQNGNASQVKHFLNRVNGSLIEEQTMETIRPTLFNQTTCSSTFLNSNEHAIILATADENGQWNSYLQFHDSSTGESTAASVKLTSAPLPAPGKAAIATSGTESVAMAFEVQTSGRSDIAVSIFDGTKTLILDSEPVSQDTNPRFNPGLCAIGSDMWILTWEEEELGQLYAYQARIEGTTIGEKQLLDGPETEKRNPKPAATDSDENYLITYEGKGSGNQDFDLFGQFFTKVDSIPTSPTATTTQSSMVAQSSSSSLGSSESTVASLSSASMVSSATMTASETRSSGPMTLTSSIEPVITPTTESRSLSTMQTGTTREESDEVVSTQREESRASATILQYNSDGVVILNSIDYSVTYEIVSSSGVVIGTFYFSSGENGSTALNVEFNDNFNPEEDELIDLFEYAQNIPTDQMYLVVSANTGCYTHYLEENQSGGASKASVVFEVDSACIGGGSSMKKAALLLSLGS